MVLPFILLQAAVLAGDLPLETDETTGRTQTSAVLENIAFAELARANPATFYSWSQDNDAEIRERTSLALGRLANQDSLSLLTQLLSDDSEQVREQAAFSMALTPNAREEILDALASEGSPGVRGELIAALGRHLEPDDIPTILEGLYGERSEIIGGITALGLAGRAQLEGVDSSVVTTPLAELVAGVELEVARLSAWALAQIRPSSFSPETETELSSIAEGHYDSIVRSRIIRALSKSFTGLTGVPLVEAAAMDHSEMVRIAAARALAHLPAERAVTALSTLLGDSNSGVRSSAAIALSSLPQGIAEPILRTHIESQDISIAVTAVTALAEWGADLEGMEDESRPNVIAAGITAHSSDEQLELAINGALPVFRTTAGMALMEVIPEDDSDESRELLRDLGWSLLDSIDPKVQAMGLDLLEGEVSLPDLEPIINVMNNGQDLDIWRSGSTVIESAVDGASRRELRRSALTEQLAVTLYTNSPQETRTRISSVMGTLGMALPPPMAGASLSLPEGVSSIVGAIIVTEIGDVHVELLPQVAPMAVATFARLSEEGFYDGIRFHRVVPDFVVQAGCPRGDGWGDPGFAVPDELSRRPYVTGSLGVANAGPDTGSSQWFITLSDQPHLNGRYTLFGEVSLDNTVLRRIEMGTEIETIRIERVEPQ
jgi:cyclophilin family peptidyl-prolyl cis-trans isomerase/HEAT repeat protein